MVNVCVCDVRVCMRECFPFLCTFKWANWANTPDEQRKNWFKNRKIHWNTAIRLTHKCEYAALSPRCQSVWKSRSDDKYTVHGTRQTRASQSIITWNHTYALAVHKLMPRANRFRHYFHDYKLIFLFVLPFSHEIFIVLGLFVAAPVSGVPHSTDWIIHWRLWQSDSG